MSEMVLYTDRKGHFGNKKCTLTNEGFPVDFPDISIRKQWSRIFQFLPFVENTRICANVVSGCPADTVVPVEIAIGADDIDIHDASGGDVE